MPSEELNALAKEVSDNSRKAKAIGSRVFLPKKYDADGNIAESPKLLSFNLKETRFIIALQRNSFDLEKALESAEVDKSWARKFFNSPKVMSLRAEHARDLELAEIPSPEWIKARHVENVQAGGTLLEGSAVDSMKELRTIVMPKTVATNTGNTFNFFNMPQLTTEQAAEVKALADKMADVTEGQIVQP